MWFKSEDVDSLIARERYGKAIKLLTKQVETEPKDMRARQKLGDVLGRAGRAPEAVEVLIPLAEDFAEKGFSNKAIAVVKKIQRLAPDDERASDLISRIRVHSELARVEIPPLIHSHLESDSAIFEPIQAATNPADATSQVSSDWFDTASGRDDFHWSPLLSRLPSHALEQTVGRLDLLVKNPGAIVYGQGQNADSVFILASGFARAYRRDSEHRYQQVDVFHEGELFGEEALFAPAEGRQSTMTAGEECELLEIDLLTLNGILRIDPNVRAHLERMSKSRPWSS